MVAAPDSYCLHPPCQETWRKRETHPTLLNATQRLPCPLLPNVPGVGPPGLTSSHVSSALRANGHNQG